MSKQQQQEHQATLGAPHHPPHHRTSSSGTTGNDVSGRSGRSTLSLPSAGSGKRLAQGQGLGAEGSDGLPPNWWAHEDPESGSTYYFNRSTTQLNTTQQNTTQHNAPYQYTALHYTTLLLLLYPSLSNPPAHCLTTSLFSAMSTLQQRHQRHHLGKTSASSPSSSSFRRPSVTVTVTVTITITITVTARA